MIEQDRLLKNENIKKSMQATLEKRSSQSIEPLWDSN